MFFKVGFLFFLSWFFSLVAGAEGVSFGFGNAAAVAAFGVYTPVQKLESLDFTLVTGVPFSEDRISSFIGKLREAGQLQKEMAVYQDQVMYKLPQEMALQKITVADEKRVVQAKIDKMTEEELKLAFPSYQDFVDHLRFEFMGARAAKNFQCLPGPTPADYSTASITFVGDGKQFVTKLAHDGKSGFKMQLNSSDGKSLFVKTGLPGDSKIMLKSRATLFDYVPKEFQFCENNRCKTSSLSDGRFELEKILAKTDVLTDAEVALIRKLTGPALLESKKKLKQQKDHDQTFMATFREAASQLQALSTRYLAELPYQAKQKNLSGERPAFADEFQILSMECLRKNENRINVKKYFPNVRLDLLCDFVYRNRQEFKTRPIEDLFKNDSLPQFKGKILVGDEAHFENILKFDFKTAQSLFENAGDSLAQLLAAADVRIADCEFDQITWLLDRYLLPDASAQFQDLIFSIPQKNRFVFQDQFCRKLQSYQKDFVTQPKANKFNTADLHQALDKIGADFAQIPKFDSLASMMQFQMALTESLATCCRFKLCEQAMRDALRAEVKTIKLRDLGGAN